MTYRRGLVEALRVQAMVATRQGCWEDAESSLAEGLALARSMADPYVEGRLLHVSGTLLARTGQPVPARQQLEEALAILRRLGARRAAAQVESSIATLAHRESRRLSAPGGGPLASTVQTVPLHTRINRTTSC